MNLIKTICMIFILALGIPFSAALANTPDPEGVCGLVQIDFENDQMWVNIADMQSYANKQQNYKVLNTQDFNWASLSGSCVCVDGPSDYDPEMGHDWLQMQITVEKILSVDSTGESCKPLQPE